jgi:DNA mismatch repair protein MutL
MSKSSSIKILDKITANQIAAGEVIEAPNSVVKELVENSIDAGSTRIEIRVEKGGLDLISVQDNGIGMSKEDLMLAFERHATSKISTTEDLNSITTLGFRGEALPSIASVARIKVTSKIETALTGWQLTITDGNIVSISEKGFNRGTTVEASELFYNTPARKKYLKNPLTEMAGITDIVSKLALAHPHISLTLLHNNRLVLKTPGTSKLIDAITSIWGTEINRNLVCLEYDEEHLQIFGYLGKINYHRPNRKGQIFFVNNRFVKSKLIAQGLEDGYRTLLPINRFPFAILLVAIEPGLIDVNIHPTKLEVKFLHPEEIKVKVAKAVSAVLESYPDPSPDDEGRLSRSDKVQATPTDFTIAKKQGPPAAKIMEEQVSFNDFNSYMHFFPTPANNLQNQQEKTEEEVQEAGLILERSLSDSGDFSYPSFMETAAAEQVLLYEELPMGLRPLGQLNKTYIVCEGTDGLYLIDQHAAHERIIYHKLSQLSHIQVSTQQLLFPIALELTPSEVDLTVEYIFKFKEFGFILEHFGGNTLVIREVPRDLPKGEEKDCFYQLLELFNNQGADNPLDFREKALILLACKTAIKAGEALSLAEINYLLTELLKVPNLATCPHGRPTIISFTHDFLAKKFFRS